MARISVLIPTRGRHILLVETVLTLHLKASGDHDVQYVIGCDADDDATIETTLALYQSGLPIVPRIGPRPPSLGGLVNQLAEKCPADVYCSLGDDVRARTERWDSVIAEAWQANPRGVWWWCSQNDATFAIVSEEWRSAAGRIFTDYFPFWFDDLWLIEVQRYVLGRKGDRIAVWLTDRTPGTHRMRDLDTWDDFFWSQRSRDERKAEARQIAERLGLPLVANPDDLNMARSQTFNPFDLEAKQGDRGPPTPEYLAVLNRAKALMAA